MAYKDGDTRTIGGVTYVRQGGSWFPRGGGTQPNVIIPVPQDPYKPAAEARAEAANVRAEAESRRQDAANARAAQASALEAAKAPLELAKAQAELAALQAKQPASKLKQDAASLLTSAGVDLAKGIDPVAGLIKGSTSGRLQAGAAGTIGGLTGTATPGMENIAKLQTIVSDMTLALTGGSLGNQISNADRDFIMQRVGNLGDPNVPANQRLAAWEQVKQRMGNVLGVKVAPLKAEQPPTIGQADYSNMVGGPQTNVATGATRNVYDPQTASALSAFIRKGKPVETANAYLASQGFTPISPQDYGAAVAYAKAHGGATNVQASKTVSTTALQRLAASPLVAGGVAATRGATAGLSDVAARALGGPELDANLQAISATNPTADLLGNIAGGAGGMLLGGGVLNRALAAGAKGGLARNAAAYLARRPLLADALGNAAYGGVYGASENSDNPLGGAVLGTITGAGAGTAGNLATRGLGAAVQGVADPAVQRLRAAGIPLTVGEVLGGGAKKAEEAYQSLPILGGQVRNRYLEGRKALNLEALNQAAAPVGGNVYATGQEGINALTGIKNRAYSVLDNASITGTPELASDIAAAIGAAGRLPRTGENPALTALTGLENYVTNPLIENAGTISGRNFQEGYRGLSRLMARKAPANADYGFEIGQALGKGQDALANALEAQNPGAYQAFLNANRANRNLNVLADASRGAQNQPGQLFTPAQLGAAATNNARTYSGKIAAAGGTRPFNQLIKDAQAVMSSTLPDSGTPFRAAVLSGLGAFGGGGGLGYLGGGGEGAAAGSLAPLAILSLLGTRGGQKALTGILANRPVAVRLAGKTIRQNPQFGARILAAAGIPLLPPQ